MDEPEDGHLAPADAAAKVKLQEPSQDSQLLQMSDPEDKCWVHKVFKWLSHQASRIHEHTRSLPWHRLHWLHLRKPSLLQSQSRNDGESVILVPLALGGVLVALSLLVCVLANTRDHSRGRWNEARYASGSQPGWKQDNRPPQFGERFVSSAATSVSVPAYAAPTTQQLPTRRVLAETKPQLHLKAPEAEESDHTALFSQAAESGMHLPSARSSIGGGGRWVHVEYVVPQDSECCLCLPSLHNAIPGRAYRATGGFNEEVLFKVGVKVEGGRETLYAWSATGEVLARSVPQPDGGGCRRYAIVDARGHSHGVVSQDHNDKNNGSPHRFLLSEATDQRSVRMTLRGNLRSEVAAYTLGGSLMAHFLAPEGGAGAYRAYLPKGADVCLLILLLLSSERLSYGVSLGSSAGRF